ncbi:cobyrinate a,c-diamide synthase [Desulfurivibrio alkaliphilus]|uniref:Cobyrinate a,c-diamide synthase n=1 Tax=Desulfurivibrio alkaliphilus (strain DSM 19089 / UNIQEM U267 / AHT2) TaxID=589865 RepID=D6Z489_DESAT|nr:cobyrinate a,c-diamide synthase [Desulfurivibrio alkaliphilus]ADH86364.1 cobyrinic acid a,c-diamide synthase [Desulfurivibrio alkaliphilus AHT 2]
MTEQQQTGAGGLLVAGLAGGSGKSVVAVGLTAALRRRGHRPAVFKKGPDYIDAGWLALAAGRPCYNLDPYLMPASVIQASFDVHRAGAELAVLEGNRGLFDGVDVEGSCSSAELARLLKVPVLLVVDCTKTTRTVAAQVLGCRHFDPGLEFAGVVLNRVGGPRHESIVRQAVERYAGLPVLGAIPRSRRDFFPQRHLGVTPAVEHGEAGRAVAEMADQAEQKLDLDRIIALMGKQPQGGMPETSAGGVPPEPPLAANSPVKIGYLLDAAFQFYYPDNLEALRAAGAELVPINALEAEALPADLDALYIGGGFPETSAARLAANRSFRESVRRAAAAGLPIYAECGGLIYLGEAMVLDGREYPLAGVFPVRFGLSRKPQAHGYTVLRVERENPFYAPGTELRGHEFRYSTVEQAAIEPAALALTMARGVGFRDGHDGLTTGNVLALYTHIHALGTPEWAPALVARASSWR